MLISLTAQTLSDQLLENVNVAVEAQEGFDILLFMFRLEYLTTFNVLL